ncbi:peptide ABC transporter substrate-binding protein [Tepidibacter formicigenes]|jgi:oligopeptide transport system substrate-binding protein|uniref:Oligopeptide transport system substrate-binding protein n=1 Tax=Tepidibacter formicigenes DSM 15518 TaxID=1123349 RepID=A0A1M6MEX4_9FIRM|nr:peptide ABC transporter substrate-binding protein [Tepidibacter formicigenes]SHJ81890.1 oligopeptide transport system substrate-binding protein [Tepidibacter formicigenes DSM 15518]
MRKLLSLLLALSLVLVSLVGCTKETKEEAGGEAAGKMIVRHNTAADPETIDPALNASVDGATILVNAFEGLMRLDENDKAIPGVAEKYEVSEDGLTYTFHLRDSKWSDGQPVKAQDFEYAWKRALDAKTAADYAYQMYYLKNGEKYNKGEASADEVGVKAIDDKTLEVTLEAPTPYFLELTAFPTYFPVRKDIVEKDPEGWALNPETHISNGPFKVVKWDHNNVLALEKNENYYDKDRVKLDGIEFYMMTEASTALSAFESGEVDYIEDMPTEEIPRLKAESDEFKIFPQLGTYFYVFNTTKEPVNDPKVRKALALAIDRKAIVEVIAKAGQQPALTFVAPGIKEPDGKEFYEKANDYGLKETAQVDEAKKLLAEAGYPDGKGFPELTVIYNTSEGHKAIAEAIQEMWNKNLGIKVNLQNQEWKVFQQTRDSGDFVIARHGWLGDYTDPMTFLDMWYSTSGNNNAHWKNKEFDKLINEAKTATDEKARFEFMHKAEDLMMEDMIVMPIYYYTNPEMIKSYVKDVRVSPLGFVYYDEAYIEK